jgi:hypothetical protein
MNTTLERIRGEAKALSLSEREVLVAALDFDLRGHEIEEEVDPPIEAAWDSEIKTRVDEIESSATELLSYTQFMNAFDEARSILRARQNA